MSTQLNVQPRLNFRFNSDFEYLSFSAEGNLTISKTALLGKNLFEVLALSEADADAVRRAFSLACSDKTSTTVEYTLDGAKYLAEITPLYSDALNTPKHEYFVKATVL